MGNWIQLNCKVWSPCASRQRVPGEIRCHLYYASTLLLLFLSQAWWDSLAWVARWTWKCSRSLNWVKNYLGRHIRIIICLLYSGVFIFCQTLCKAAPGKVTSEAFCFKSLQRNTWRYLWTGKCKPAFWKKMTTNTKWIQSWWFCLFRWVTYDNVSENMIRLEKHELLLRQNQNIMKYQYITTVCNF